MDMEREIAEYLKQKYDPEAIVLHGSRARGKAADLSDWDIDVFVSSPQEGGTEIFEGQALDVDVIVLPVHDAVFAERGMVNLKDGKILFENNSAGTDMIRRAQELYAAGKKLSERDRENRRIKLWRMLRRLQANAGKNEVFFYHLAAFYPLAIRYWLELKGRWSEPIYVAEEIIQKEDPEYWEYVKVLSESEPNQNKVAAAEKIYLALFQEFPN